MACLPLGTAMDLLDSPQLASREFFVILDDRETAVPGRPYHLHLADRCEEVAPPPFTPAEHTLRPLEGVRVVGFSWVLTGPICTRYLASLGAEVIKMTRADSRVVARA